jgi:transketolase
MESDRSIRNLDTIALAKAIRVQCLHMTHKAKSSHIGSSLSIADILSVLYGAIMNIRPNDPKWSERDRFILSKGHACSAVYATLAEVGYFSREKLESYGADYSDFMTHISSNVPGVEFSTGSLGHGLPFGAGKSLAAKRSNKRWRTYVVLSDGELGEGSNWEAIMFSAHHKLDNLFAIVDYNKLQSLTTVEKTLRLEPLADKARAFGWSVRETNGHDHSKLNEDLVAFPWEVGKPSLLIAHTIKGKGVSFMENNVDWHYKSPSADQLAQALRELNHA